VAVNVGSDQAIEFFNAGGLGILVGDGKLSKPGTGSGWLKHLHYRWNLGSPIPGGAADRRC
jgi:hypothetical protein